MSGDLKTISSCDECGDDVVVTFKEMEASNYVFCRTCGGKSYLENLDLGEANGPKIKESEGDGVAIGRKPTDEEWDEWMEKGYIEGE